MEEYKEPIEEQELTIEKAKERLKKYVGDNEIAHSIYDDIIEEKLREYNAEFVEELQKYKDELEIEFWYA